MGSEVTELTTVPRNVYLPSVECCCESDEPLNFTLSLRGPEGSDSESEKYGRASQVAGRTKKRRVLGNISDAFCRYR
jgi:hypothetical protein